MVDRKVFEPDTYTFFVDDELCKIYLELNNQGQFVYRFEIDTESDTPLNQARKKDNRKNIIYSLLTFFGIALLLGVLVGSGYFYNQYVDAKELKKYAAYTEATIHTRISDGRRLAFYAFTDSTGYNAFYKKIKWPLATLWSGYCLSSLCSPLCGATLTLIKASVRDFLTST